MVCDAYCSRKRAGGRSADGKDHRQKSVESVESFEKTEAVPGQREAVLKYGDDVSRLYFCQKQSVKRAGGGTKQIQGVSEADRK